MEVTLSKGKLISFTLAHKGHVEGPQNASIEENLNLELLSSPFYLS